MKTIKIPRETYDYMINYCSSRYPEQSRGIFSNEETGDEMVGATFHKLESNHKRFEVGQKEKFKSYGDYYDSSKGFVTDPLELHKVNQQLDRQNSNMVGLFHVHIDFPAAPSRLDIETFEMSFGESSSEVWYSILSLLNKNVPEFRVFWIKNGLCQEIQVQIIESS